jgi:hypothetical protein
MPRIKDLALWLVVWVAVWLAVGEALYRGAGWDRTLSGLVGVLTASVAARLFDQTRRADREL